MTGEGRLHTIKCMHVPVSFISFQLTPGLQAQSLRRNSGHEILLFKLSSNWQYTQLTQAGRHWAHYRGKMYLLSILSKNTGKPSSSALGIPRFWAQNQICIRSACCNWTHTAGEVCNKSSLYLPTLFCMNRSQFLKKDNVVYPLIAISFVQLSATVTFPRALGALLPFHSS